MSAITSPSPPSSALVEHISAHAGSLPSARRLRPYFLNSASLRSASGPPAQKVHLSILQAVTQPLHSMQRSASHRNFILAMVVSSSLCPLDLADCGLGFLHHRDAVVAVGRRGVDRLPANDRRRPVGIVGQHVLALPPA